MLFYTPEFLVFFLLLLGTLGVVHRSEPRKLVLLAASYIFYMWWNPAFILLIAFSTAVNFVTAGQLVETEDARRRKLLLAVSMLTNLGLLFFFKYFGLFSDSLLGVMRLLGSEPSWTSLNVVLPVGISFYTFQTMSYTIDVYRRNIPPAKTPLDFALYVAFFPQLVAGPIVRAGDFLPQLEKPVRLSCDQRSFFLIVRGLAKKVLIADNLAILVDGVFADPAPWPSFMVWIATVGFAIQIYCDFSGYSDIAIGIAKILGFKLPQNFDHPYIARNPSDFWKRWHISLSTWLRDYLYISLGGNRGGSLATYRNLLLTMLLGGLWHGASWNFVVWGLLHGALLIGHRFYTENRPRRPSPSGLLVSLLSIVAMQYFVLLTWISFRLTDFDDMLVVMTKFVVFDFNISAASVAGLNLGSLTFASSLAIMSGFVVLHAVSIRTGHISEYLGTKKMPVAIAVCLLFGFTSFFLWPLAQPPFIYFQF